MIERFKKDFIPTQFHNCVEQITYCVKKVSDKFHFNFEERRFLEDKSPLKDLNGDVICNPKPKRYINLDEVYLGSLNYLNPNVLTISEFSEQYKVHEDDMPYFKMSVCIPFGGVCFDSLEYAERYMGYYRRDILNEFFSLNAPVSSYCNQQIRIDRRYSFHKDSDVTYYTFGNIPTKQSYALSTWLENPKREIEHEDIFVSEDYEESVAKPKNVGPGRLLRTGFIHFKISPSRLWVRSAYEKLKNFSKRA